jgi:hypothetical protein
MLGPGEWIHEKGKSTCSKLCPVTGDNYSVTIKTEQFHQWRYQRRFIQDVCPELSDEKREFIISGNTPGMWKQMFEGLEEE